MHNNCPCQIMWLWLWFIFFTIIVIALKILFFSLAVTKINKKLKITFDFLAWIPIINFYSLGKIVDNINKDNNEKSVFRFILPLTFCLFFISIFLSQNLLIILIMYLFFLVFKLICYIYICKKYIPNELGYLIPILIFSIIPIVPFIPETILLMISKKHVYALQN